MERASESLIPRPLYSIPVTITLLFLLGAISALTILMCFYWLTARLDSVQTEGALALTNVVVADTLDNLNATVTDFAHWTLAYDVVVQRLDEDVADILGSSATDNDLFDQLLILSPEGHVLYDFRSTGANFPSGEEVLPALRDVLGHLTSEASEDFGTVAGYSQLETGYAAVSMARITPEEYEGLDQSVFPIMVGIIHLEASWMDDLSRHAGQIGYRAEPAQDQAGSATLPLTGVDGTPVGYLNWNRSTVGTELRLELQGLIVSICIGIFGVSLFAARFFRSQHRSLQQLRALAATDQLTGILNRAGLDQITRSDVASSGIASGEAALIYLDLNDFKKLNDELGHKAGDEALKAMAKTLRSAAREKDVVARMGGDEFVCLIYDKDPHRASVVVTERIRTLTNDPIKLAGVCVTVNPSIGVAVARSGLEWDTLLSQADAAMYKAKRSGSLDAAFFRDSLG
jgi:diguanylate cyclase (GGDEF)-like protein